MLIGFINRQLSWVWRVKVVLVVQRIECVITDHTIRVRFPSRTQCENSQKLNLIPMKKEQKIVKSKRDCFCAETGREIKRGDECLLLPETKNVVCKDSTLFKEYVATVKRSAKPLLNITSILIF